MEFKQFRDKLSEHFRSMCDGSARLFLSEGMDLDRAVTAYEAIPGVVGRNPHRISRRAVKEQAQPFWDGIGERRQAMGKSDYRMFFRGFLAICVLNIIQIIVIVAFLLLRS